MMADRKYRKDVNVNPNPDVLLRRIRRLEGQVGSLSPEGDKAVQILENAVAELTVRVANLESQAESLPR
jgi:hypothetical protein